MLFLSRIFVVLSVAVILSGCATTPPLQSGHARLVIIRDSDSAESKTPAILKVDTRDKTLSLYPGQYSWIDLPPGYQEIFWKIVWPKQMQNDAPGSRQQFTLAANETRYLEVTKLSADGYAKGWMIKWLNEDEIASDVLSGSTHAEWKTQLPWPWRDQ
jgi:hypothetical protein